MTKEHTETSNIKTEKVFSPSFPARPLQLAPELEVEDTTSVSVLETEYDDQDYTQPDFDYEESDDNYGWYLFFLNLILIYETSEAIAAREEAIKSHIYKDDLRKMFACNLCHFGASSRYKAFCHIEAGVYILLYWYVFHTENIEPSILNPKM